MKRTTCGTAVALLVLAACGKSSDPVGENSAGSVRTTAVGTIVGSEPTATPSATPSPLVEAPAPDAITGADNATTTVTTNAQ
ncbi:MAG: hypothetical protein J0I47_08885 [Sphingomonas sp.]|uniref:hypothetical protein n=1 Tax=Sphingomonas sp. TaxID=28214 RepID=UPI001AC2F95F|nr:hypothetical protein [Sphingomonas sp.]MBN8808333.1 hypothetical protein [Sphingomonas sp.]